MFHPTSKVASQFEADHHEVSIVGEYGNSNIMNEMYLQSACVLCGLLINLLCHKRRRSRPARRDYVEIEEQDSREAADLRRGRIALF